MINVKYNPAEYSLEVTGHAGTGPQGHDIICAAASMLTYTLAAMLTETGGMDEEILQDEENAVFRAKANPDILHMYPGRIIYDTIVTGFEGLAKTHPEAVALEVFIEEEEEIEEGPEDEEEEE